MRRITVGWFAWTLVLSTATGCKTDSSQDSKDVDSTGVAGEEGSAKGSEAASSDEAQQIETAKQVVKLLAAGRAAPLHPMFDRAMRRAFPDDPAVAKWWQNIVQQTGAFRKHFSAKRETKGKSTTIVLTCLFANAPQDVQVTFNRQGQVTGLEVAASTNPDVRPQTPQPPFPYAAREVSYDNTQSSTTIAGTLTVPPGDGPHPAVLLISGSGAQDRDGTLSGHRLFLVIADHLSRNGIAVLRVDDRGVGGSTGDPAEETVELIASDVQSSLGFLASQRQLDPKRIGLIGHSVGGMVAPMVAARSPEVAFVVSLAGPAVSGVELIPVQVSALLQSQGHPEQAIAAIVAAHEKLAPLIASDAPESKLKPAVARLVEAALPIVPNSDDPRVAKAAREQLEQQVATPWHRSFARFEPAQHLGRLTKPILLLFGEKDVVVPAKLNSERAKQTLGKAGNQNMQVETLPGLNHLFQKAGTGAMSEYVLLTETFNPAALDRMTAWIRETTGLEPKK